METTSRSDDWIVVALVTGAVETPAVLMKSNVFAVQPTREARLTQPRLVAEPAYDMATGYYVSNVTRQ